MRKGVGISFTALFNNASIGIVVADTNGTIALANPFLLSQFGYTESELVGEPIERLLPHRFHINHKQHVRHFNQHPKNRPMGLGMDLFAVRKDGSEFPVEVSLGNYKTKKGKFVIAFLSDVSKRKEVESALKQLNEELEKKIEERTMSLTRTVKQLAQSVADTKTKDAELNRINNFLNNIWDHAEAIIFVTDKQGVIKMFNPTAERHLGYAAKKIINIKTPIFFHDPQEIAQRAQQLSKQFHTLVEPGFDTLKIKAERGLHNELEAFYLRKDGTRFPVSLTITAMRDVKGNIDGYLGIAIDISERRKADADLRLALEKEKELSELKSRFVSMASHEFRTPLSTVLSSAFLISKYTDTESHPKREKHVQRIVSSVNMLTDILNDFLSVGKIEEGKVQVRISTFDIEQKIQEIVSEMKGLLKKGQKVRYTHTGDKNVLLDPGLLKHLTMNLLSNAIKFSGEEALIEISSNKADDGLTFSVKDRGMGIPEADIEHLFERFFRGTNANHIQGTGLGLHIVHKYVELMNGEIHCKSELGKGTTFEIKFLVTT